MPSPRLGAGRWAPAVRSGLERMLDQAGSSVAAFDFDDTCLDGDISHNLLEDLDRDRPGLVEAYLRACRDDLRAAYVRLVGTLVAGQTAAEVTDRARRSLDRGLADGRLRLVPEVRELVARMHDAGWEVWVVTASPAPVVRAIVDRYGIPEGRVIGMVPAVGPDGRYTHEVLEPVTFQEGKLAAFRAATGRDPVFAAGDSASDRHLLDAARFALLVDRGDAVLRDEARSKGWWIQECWR